MPQATKTPVFFEVRRAYQSEVRSKLLWFLVLTVLTAVLAMAAIILGSYDLTPWTVLQTLMGKGQGAADIVVWNLRLPRVVAAIVAGWGLSMAGLAMQASLMNPLASPSTLGVTQGAAMGAAAAVVIFGTETFSITMFAFLGASIATVIITLMARLKPLSPEAVVLAGVALSFLFRAATVLVQYLATETQLAQAVFWAFGDVARSSWSQIGFMSLATVLMTLWFFQHRWDFNALAAGEETARGLGVGVTRLRIVGMALSTFLAALITAYHGEIAFLGLVAPHMARRLVGGNHSLLLPFSMVVGAFLLLAADTVGRLVVGSGALPVGVLTAFMGAPLFLYLLIRRYQ